MISSAGAHRLIGDPVDKVLTEAFLNGPLHEVCSEEVLQLLGHLNDPGDASIGLDEFPTEDVRPADPMKLGSCTPPTMPAKVEKVMPQGVSPWCSLVVIMMPLHSGTMAMIASKQPQEVIGFSIRVYKDTSLKLPWEAVSTTWLTLSQRPLTSSVAGPLMMGWLGPLASIWWEARASSQVTAPQRPTRSGVTTQT